jgi:hypothetical protein
MSERPILIDPADGACEICLDWMQKKTSIGPDGKLQYHCDCCGGVIAYEAIMGGRGIDSVVPHHYHLRGIGPGSYPGREGIHQELCKDCAIALRLKVYPPGQTNRNGQLHPTEQQMREYKG